MFNLDEFIGKYVTKRQESMFLMDIENNKDKLTEQIEGKSVLVIGGAGSIGSAFIRAVLPFRPASLTVVDVNENGLAELTRDLRSTKDMYVPEIYLTYAIDYSSDLFGKIFRANKGYDIVANFSAHKHVRSEKDIYSVEALIRNNVINAKKLLDLLKELPPEKYFCVSTDKAANPVNIMGASKRIMEDLIFAYSDYFPVKTARFANVAFSNGSLPDGFTARFSKKQPLSAPTDVKRYFVSPAESGQICMLACMLGKTRQIFYPKLEEKSMMSFDEIAVKYLDENGYKPLMCHTDEEAVEKAYNMEPDSTLYPVYFSESNTSGEKAYEEFYIETEKVDETTYNSLGVIVDKPAVDIEKVQSLIEKLEAVFSRENCSKQDVVDVIKEYIPEFMHIEKGKSLDEKM